MAEVASLGPGRHEARERAVGLLYEAEARELTGRGLLAELPLAPDAYAIAAIEGIEDDQAGIDNLIDQFAQGWTVDRLPNVDRAILRLSVWELCNRPEVPTAVVINEAVELAKEYSTEQSSGFVNGVLDAVARQVR